MNANMIEEHPYLVKDREGNEFYSLEQTLHVLGIGRSSFEKLRKEMHLIAWKRSHDRKHYYRVEDILSLQEEEADFLPVSEKRLP